MLYGMRLPSDNLMQFALPQFVCILLKINFHAFYNFITGISKFLETKYVFYIENGFRFS